MAVIGRKTKYKQNVALSNHYLINRFASMLLSFSDGIKKLWDEDRVHGERGEHTER